MNDQVIWVVCLGAAAVLVYFFRIWSRKKTESLHDCVELVEIYAEVSDSISIQNFTDVFNALGDSYSIDPRMLRPGDPLENLESMDSWILGAGAEKMNKWLENRGVTLNDQEQVPRTVYDLLFLIESKNRGS